MMRTKNGVLGALCLVIACAPTTLSQLFFDASLDDVALTEEGVPTPANGIPMLHGDVFACFGDAVGALVSIPYEPCVKGVYVTRPQGVLYSTDPEYYLEQTYYQLEFVYDVSDAQQGNPLIIGYSFLGSQECQAQQEQQEQANAGMLLSTLELMLSVSSFEEIHATQDDAGPGLPTFAFLEFGLDAEDGMYYSLAPNYAEIWNTANGHDVSVYYVPGTYPECNCQCAFQRWQCERFPTHYNQSSGYCD